MASVVFVSWNSNGIIENRDVRSIVVVIFQVGGGTIPPLQQTYTVNVYVFWYRLVSSVIRLNSVST